MKPSFGRAMVGGFTATIALTLILYYLAPFLLGGPMDIAAMLGALFGTTLGMGLLIHLILGTIAFPMLYTYLIFRVIRGSHWVRGLAFGILLWLLAETLFVPLVGSGIFHSIEGGVPAALASLIGHVVYGVVLGVISGGPRTAAVPA